MKKKLRSLFKSFTMGGTSSRDDFSSRGSFGFSSSPPRSSSSSRGDYPHYYYPPSHGQQQPQPQHHQFPPPYYSSSQSTGTSPRGGGGGGYQEPPPRLNDPMTDVRRRRIQRTFSKIADNYSSLDQVTEALSQAGLESSNLIVGIDFTKSNEWTGKKSFSRRSLHHIGDMQNPYEQAISIIGRTLSSFDEDNLIPCFGFGDASTHDQDVFSFYPDGRSCDGFEEALSRYREITPDLRLAGPTSFAPIIEMAMTIVEQSGGQYHVLLIIADGQVTRSVNTVPGQLSSQEQKTVDAIVQASQYPLSIVLVGVGDGPWDMMKEFDDNIPARSFDNFQFVNFTEIMLKNAYQSKKEMEFALAALMEIPSQYIATLELGILGRRTGRSPDRVALPTPSISYGRTSSFTSKTYQLSGFPKNATYSRHGSSASNTSAAGATVNAAPTPRSSWDTQACPVCLVSRKDMAFGCGHQTCCDCGQTLENCPICRSAIVTRIKLY